MIFNTDWLKNFILDKATCQEVTRKISVWFNGCIKLSLIT